MKAFGEVDYGSRMSINSGNIETSNKIVIGWSGKPKSVGFG
jgi:hypothetical protein